MFLGCWVFFIHFTWQNFRGDTGLCIARKTHFKDVCRPNRNGIFGLQKSFPQWAFKYQNLQTFHGPFVSAFPQQNFTVSN